jgi:hypothetical protein
MTNEITKNNAFEISTFAEAERYAKMLAESDFAPKDYKGKPGNVLIAMQMGHELGLKPMQAIQNIAVINGRPMVWGDAALALVRGNPECEYVKEWMEGTFKGGDGISYCESKRGKEITRREFSVKQAVQAGLIGKPGPWTQYPERMLQMRARGYCLRDSFPDVLKGVYIEGELDSIETEIVTEIKDQPKLGIAAVKQAVITHPNTEVDINTGEIIDQPEENNGLSFDEVKKKMEDAKTVDDLILASDIARSLTLKADKRDELAKIYKKKQLEVKS